MEIQLINGRFTIEEAEQLLTTIFKVKVNFHEHKIEAQLYSEEDIKHSEKRIRQLEQSLKKVIDKIKSSDEEMIDIDASINLHVAHKIHQ